MIPTQDVPHYEDTYIVTAPTSAAFRCDGRDVYLLNESEARAFFTLKRKMIVTYRNRPLEPVGAGIYLCIMDGSDGSVIAFHVTEEDVHENIEVAAGSLETQYCDCVC